MIHHMTLFWFCLHHPKWVMIDSVVIQFSMNMMMIVAISSRRLLKMRQGQDTNLMQNIILICLIIVELTISSNKSLFFPSQMKGHTINWLSKGLNISSMESYEEPPFDQGDELSWTIYLLLEDNSQVTARRWRSTNHEWWCNFSTHNPPSWRRPRHWYGQRKNGWPRPMKTTNWNFSSITLTKRTNITPLFISYEQVD